KTERGDILCGENEPIQNLSFRAVPDDRPPCPSCRPYATFLIHFQSIGQTFVTLCLVKQPLVCDLTRVGLIVKLENPSRAGAGPIKGLQVRREAHAIRATRPGEKFCDRPVRINPIKPALGMLADSARKDAARGVSDHVVKPR